MRRALIAGAFLALGGCAWAAGYDDFTKAAAYRGAGNPDKALESYTAALNAGDLAPAYIPDAYLGRAEIYLQKGKCASAQADADAALKLRPKLLDAMRLRARANDCLGKADLALADLDAMVAAEPSPQMYATRGSFNWFHGQFAKAAEDYGKSAGLHKERDYDRRTPTYALLWYAISASRAQSFNAADFAAKARAFDLDDWPGPLVSFFLGKMTSEKLYREAADGDGDAPKDQKCDTDFFTAEWKLASDSTAAKAQLQSVVDGCPKNMLIVRAARTDLRRIP